MFKRIIFVVFLILHICLFNINAVEWGDSYRILRASEYVRHFSYPSDEKRPPMFSLILALRPTFIDQVFFGKVVLLLFSLASFLIFAKLSDLLLPPGNSRNFALLLFTLNPVFLYWSLRIYADVPFTFLVMLCTYLYFLWKNHLTYKHVLILGVLCGIAVLTRFEGYILFAALGVGLLLSNDWSRDVLSFHKLFKLLQIKFRYLILYVTAFSVLVLPYLIFNNPLASKYLEEPGGRSYDVKMVLIYAVSLLFMFGFTAAFAFIGNFKILLKSPFITTYLIFELLLILLWPAAIPRLFLPVLPFFILGLSGSLNLYFVSKQDRKSVVVWSGLLTLAYLVAQYFLKLQFLVPFKLVLLLVLGLQIVVIWSIWTKNIKVFIGSLAVSCLIWSLSSIWVHKDIYISAKDAAVYSANNLEGLIGYNDVSSVTDWYLNVKNPNDAVVGSYYNYNKKADLNYDALLARGYCKLLLELMVQVEKVIS
jgi:4-amino-4-deoxy-L-arabinose transferase-like glycosyltransferase